MEETENHDNIKPNDDRGRITILVIIGILIGVVIGHIISPYISELTNSPEDPIYQQYNKSSWGESTVYRNEELKVEITVNHYLDENSYDARWVNITGNDNGFYGWWNPSSLHERILEYPEELSENQLKWFDYMLRFIVR